MAFLNQMINYKILKMTCNMPDSKGLTDDKTKPFIIKNLQYRYISLKFLIFS